MCGWLPTNVQRDPSHRPWVSVDPTWTISILISQAPINIFKKCLNYFFLKNVLIIIFKKCLNKKVVVRERERMNDTAQKKKTFCCYCSRREKKAIRRLLEEVQVPSSSSTTSIISFLEREKTFRFIFQKICFVIPISSDFSLTPKENLETTKT